VSRYSQPWTIYYDSSKRWWQNPYTITGQGGGVVAVAETKWLARRALRREQRREEHIKRHSGGPSYWEGEVISR
jgi:hypothetical protein